MEAQGKVDQPKVGKVLSPDVLQVVDAKAATRSPRRNYWDAGPGGGAARGAPHPVRLWPRELARGASALWSAPLRTQDDAQYLEGAVGK
jgi:hypothetical protein